MGNLGTPAATWLAETFEYERCAECRGDACHHTVIPSPFGHPFARCDYPPAHDDVATPHPVILAYLDSIGQPWTPET